MTQSKETQKESQSEDLGCSETDTSTQKSIKAEKDKYCDQLYAASGEVETWETSFKEKKELNYEKKCFFHDVEKNYRILRNYNISIGSKFSQANDTVKENIAQCISRNTALAETLKKIATEIGSLKNKMLDLRDQACKLEAGKDDSCNISQWNLLKGESGRNNKSQPNAGQVNKCTAHCEDYINKLICMPKSLAADIDSLFKVSADVKGIHVFSNMSSLESMRTSLADSAQTLTNHMQSTAVSRESDLKKIQEELIQVIKDRVKSNISRYNARSNFEGIKDAVEFMCDVNDKCDCINEIECEPRLKDCEARICHICREVKRVYCPEHGDHTDHTGHQFKEV